jgi:hypothetical protein
VEKAKGTLCNLWGVAALFLTLVLITGCTSYYKVSDVATGKVYYTTGVDHKNGGAIAFKDAKTKSNITLQSSEVQQIDKDQFTVGVYSEK